MLNQIKGNSTLVEMDIRTNKIDK